MSDEKQEKLEKLEQLKKQPSIEAGWSSYRQMVLDPQAPPDQISECRLAFWGGASVLFYAFMNMLDPGEEPTDADMQKISNIHQEIEKFAETFDEEVFKRGHIKVGRA